MIVRSLNSMKFLLAWLFSITPSLLSGEQVAFDERVGNMIRDKGIVVSDGEFHSQQVMQRLSRFAAENKGLELARLTVASDGAELAQGTALVSSPRCDIAPPGKSVRNFAQVYSRKGLAVARLLVNGKLRVVQLTGTNDPTLVRSLGFAAKLVSFHVDGVGEKLDQQLVVFYFRVEKLPPPAKAGDLARKMKEALKLNNGAAIFRRDSCFSPEGGPYWDVFHRRSLSVPTLVSDASTYVSCDLAEPLHCEARSRAMDKQEEMDNYQRRKTEFIREDERLKRLERSK